MEDVVFAARQTETMMFGKYESRIPIHINTDSEGALESIVSTKQIERNIL